MDYLKQPRRNGSTATSTKRIKEARPIKPRLTLEEITRKPQPERQAPPREANPIETISLPQLVELASKSNRLSAEIYTRMNKLISEEAAKKTKRRNTPLLLDALNYSILCFIATDYAMSGRLHEDHLTKVYPKRVRPFVPLAVDQLIRRGLLERELGHKRNIALTATAKQMGVLFKYNYRLGPNGAR